MKNFTYFIGCICLLSTAHAQVRIYSPGRVAERSVENRANSRVNQGIDRGLDKVEEGIIGIFKKKPAPAKQQPANTSTEGNPANTGQAVPDDGNANGSSAARPGTSAGGAAPGTARPALAGLTAYSRFDFVPGEKLLVVDDFMQDAVGDFPSKWNTNSTGEIVTIEGTTGHWLALNKQGQFLPEYITSLPDNFTLQFNLACTSPFSFYSTGLHTAFAALKDPAKEFARWGQHASGDQGVAFVMHPMAAGGKQGNSEINVRAGGERIMHNDVALQSFWAEGRNFVKVSVWRQRQRLRVYVNEEKVWDLPRAFQPDVVYNSVVFGVGAMHRPENSYYISDLRLAVGTPDTRNKLLTEGKFVTRGILFDPNSDRINPDSYGALKDIAAVLTENQELNVQIVGHTDADGDDAKNMALSKRRAEAVRAALSSQFGVSASRLTTDGKGESQPSASNTSLEGKANNRRVEFIVMK